MVAEPTEPGELVQLEWTVLQVWQSIDLISYWHWIGTGHYNYDNYQTNEIFISLHTALSVHDYEYST